MCGVMHPAMGVGRRRLCGSLLWAGLPSRPKASSALSYVGYCHFPGLAATENQNCHAPPAKSQGKRGRGHKQRLHPLNAHWSGSTSSIQSDAFSAAGHGGT